ncbi:AbrB/MazE/SpoVT family DNA-binding domain-containing protein [uncultured Rhodospira sp.]|uniref:AbrB/MazE/SpoVT family DNA-binding domain-containing protein n=1 Tax=uncultured Rhodospira sp. TaxID=1936189 RepID=UPI00262D453A|nr:AbrB/MazE/SpoVT family DNA-binding domain-containing protein [uncultured Rhodospira sp.]
MHATLSSKGQITVPKALRDRLRLSPGDRVAFVLDDDGSVRIVPKPNSVRDLKGCLPRPAAPVSLEDMDRAIADGAASEG